MGAIERSGYRFEPEYSVIKQNGAIHVFHKGDFVKELTFSFSGKYPEPAQIDTIVDEFCEQEGIP